MNKEEWQEMDSIDFEKLERKAKNQGLTFDQFLEQAILKHLHESKSNSGI